MKLNIGVIVIASIASVLTVGIPFMEWINIAIIGSFVLQTDLANYLNAKVMVIIQYNFGANNVRERFAVSVNKHNIGIIRRLKLLRM